jgi:hypothetical protein
MLYVYVYIYIYVHIYIERPCTMWHRREGHRATPILNRREGAVVQHDAFAHAVARTKQHVAWGRMYSPNCFLCQERPTGQSIYT